MNELQRIEKVYKERINNKTSSLYSPWQPYIYMSRHKKEKQLFSLLKKNHIKKLSQQKLLEIGCGKGNKILELIQMGFHPENITGNELMSEEATTAKTQLPQSITIYSGDATKLPFPEKSFDIVHQSMVFSSILDDEFKKNSQKKCGNGLSQVAEYYGTILLSTILLIRTLKEFPYHLLKLYSQMLKFQPNGLL